jgi:acyl carrier protein
MSFTFKKIRIILYEKFSYPYNQIQPQTQFELELGMDSREMLVFLSELEEAFDLMISFDEVDTFLEKKKVVKIQDLMDYIDERLDDKKVESL